MKKSGIKRVALIAVSSSLALILSYIEAMLPPLYAAVPGVKLGLANIVIIFVLMRLGLPYAAAVSGVRLLLSSLLFGFSTLPYSAAGALLSLTVMVIMKRIGKFSPVGISVCGGLAHNVGQVLMAMLILGTSGLKYYMIALSVSGVVAGVAVGICGALLLRYIPEKLTK